MFLYGCNYFISVLVDRYLYPNLALVSLTTAVPEDAG